MQSSWITSANYLYIDVTMLFFSIRDLFAPNLPKGLLSGKKLFKKTQAKHKGAVSLLLFIQMRTFLSSRLKESVLHF